MHRNLYHQFPHPVIFKALWIALLFLVGVPFVLPAQKKLSKSELDKIRVDSLFDDAEKRGLDTKGKLRYEFYFRDADLDRMRAFSERLAKDTFETANIYAAGKVWLLTVFRNTRYKRESLDRLESKLQWIKYNYFIDDYLGFAIMPADLDPVAVPESEFMSYLQELTDEELFWVGNRLLQLKSYDKALNALKLGVARNYKSDTANYRYGLALIATNEYTDAVEHWKRAIRINANYLEVHLKMGEVLFDSGYFEEALKHYQIANEIKPNDPQILLLNARTLYNLERYNQSLTYAKQARKLDKKDVFIKSLITLLKEPRVRYLRKKFPEK